MKKTDSQQPLCRECGKRSAVTKDGTQLCTWCLKRKCRESYPDFWTTYAKIKDSEDEHSPRELYRPEDYRHEFDFYPDPSMD